MTSANTNTNTNTRTCMTVKPEHTGTCSGSSAVWDDPHLLLPAPRPALPLLGLHLGCWFSCCVPKKPMERTIAQQLPKVASTDQDETERTDLEEEDDDEGLRMMGSFLDAVDEDEDVPSPNSGVLPSNTTTSSNNNKSARSNSLAQDILQTLLGIFMIHYFIDAFRQKEPPKRILAETDSTEKANEPLSTIET